MSESITLQAIDLSRRFGQNLAVANISITVPRGTRVGIVGADGAGKTTLLQMLAGILDPSSGSCRVFDYDSRRQSKKIATRIGYMSQGFTLYDRLSVDENLEFFARLHDVTNEQYQLRRNTLLQMAGLTAFTQRPAGQLSGGMRKKLSLCTNLVHEPELLILDEPGLGVDPLSRRQLWEMLDRFRQQEVTTIVATSYMDEAMRCDRVLLLQDGKLLADSTPDSLLEQLKGRVFSISFDSATAPEEVVAKALRRIQGTHSLQRLPDRFRCVTDDAEFEKRVASELRTNITVKPAAPQLEDLFVLHSGEQFGEKSLDLTTLTPKKYNSGVRTENLSIRFGNFTAVDGVSLTVDGGELLALLGPNGAGKTTMIRAFCGLAVIDEGSAVVAGEAVSTTNRNLKRQIGYMSQKFSLYLDMTAAENLAFFANLYGLSGKVAQTAIDWASSVTGLNVPLQTLATELSGAVRQRLALACSILHQPAVLFLDEPTSGIDPISRYRFWDVIRTLVSAGMTVIVTTHYLDEAAYCDRLALMMSGRLISHGTRDELAHIGGLAPDTDMETLFLQAVARATSAEQVGGVV